MKTFLATSTIQFEVCSNDSGELTDTIYAELGYNVDSYSQMVIDELREHSTFEVSNPVVKQV